MDRMEDADKELVKADNADALEKRIEEGLDVDAVDEDGRTPPQDQLCVLSFSTAHHLIHLDFACLEAHPNQKVSQYNS
jgi:hypothetical protein